METVRSFKQSSINLAMQDRTLRFRLQGPGAYHITRNTFVQSLDYLGIYDIEGMWKAEDVLEYQVTFRSYESVKFLKELSLFDVYKDVKAIVTNANESVQNLRFYWVPLYVENECLIDYLESKTLKIVSQEYLKDEDGINNGVRQFRVLGTKDAVHKLPHLLDFELYNFQCLLRVQGREPMCLRCKRLGHLRNACPEIKEAQQRRGYFQKSSSQGFQQQPSSQGFQQQATKASTSQSGRRWENLKTPPPAKDSSLSSDSESRGHVSESDQEGNSVIENDAASNVSTGFEQSSEQNVVTNKNNESITENNDEENVVTNNNNESLTEKDNELDTKSKSIDDIAARSDSEAEEKKDDELDTTITTDNSIMEHSQSEPGNEGASEVSEPLLKDDGSLAGTQPAYFEEKHSLTLRSKSHRKKKK